MLHTVSCLLLTMQSSLDLAKGKFLGKHCDEACFIDPLRCLKDQHNEQEFKKSFLHSDITDWQVKKG